MNTPNTIPFNVKMSQLESRNIIQVNILRKVTKNKDKTTGGLVNEKTEDERRWKLCRQIISVTVKIVMICASNNRNGKTHMQTSTTEQVSSIDIC